MPRQNGRWYFLLLLTFLAILAGVTGCSSTLPVTSTAGNASGQTGESTSASVSNPDDRYYVSIGDSYAAGYQPSGSGGGTTRNGFAYQVVDNLQTPDQPVDLVNFGCSGTTSTAMVTENGCDQAALGPGADEYADLTQGAAAVKFLNEHQGQIDLVTVIIGGNDLRPCLQEADPRACVESILPVLQRNLTGLLQAVRAAAGPDVPIVGLTYPDVYLAQYKLDPSPTGTAMAEASLTLFRDYLNPALAQAYQSVGAKFIDITAATGAYGSLDETTDLSPYGSIPTPVAQICTLTYYCDVQDVHPTTSGYALIADQVLSQLGGS